MQQSRFVAAAARIVQGVQGGALRGGVPALLQRGVLALTLLVVSTLLLQGMTAVAHAAAVDARQIFAVAPQKPVDSELKVKVGDVAPDFALPGVDGNTVQLASFRGRQAVVLSFVPAAFTPVCSGQWPGYDLLRDEFEKRNATLIGITTDNVASLYAWTRQMGTDAAGEPTGVWFPVVSDFWPHGATAARYGLLRSDGTTERALIVVDRQGIIRFIHVSDINRRPPIDPLFKALDGLNP